jgi:murein DD-endopeptidase MepM/ murein hydrolase activator NlpD
MVVAPDCGCFVVAPGITRERANTYVTPPPARLPQLGAHTWFRRPIDLADQPYIDQTYRFGSTMGGNFQAHQGVEFNNPDGTPVHAIGDGVVVYAGKAEAGANTVAIRHDRRFTPGHGPGVNPGATPQGNPPDSGFVFSVYYHNSKLLVKAGDRVKAGDVISLVGNTGRATNDHLHLEVHVAPTTDSSKIVDSDVRYPLFNVNPELWIQPMPGTGVVAGQVWDSKGQPVQQARIYGLVKPEPQETPLSYVETYGPRNHQDPAYHEHFAIGDVPAGEYTMGVQIEGKKVYRTVRIEPGQLTWVEFRPDAH